MTEFERGVRFVMERTETYTKGSGPDITQFGDYQMTMIQKDTSAFTQGSNEHRERRIKAIVSLGQGVQEQ